MDAARAPHPTREGAWAPLGTAMEVAEFIGGNWVGSSTHNRTVPHRHPHSLPANPRHYEVS